MIRAVLDTNILVSALLQPQGVPAQLLLFALAGSVIQLCVSAEIYTEYEEVIRRPRLRRSPSEIESALKSIREKGVWVRTDRKVHACTDPDDNIFLECAEAAQAEYLVTGNRKDFPTEWAGTRIVSPRQFLDAISGFQDNPRFGPR